MNNESGHILVVVKHEVMKGQFRTILTYSCLLLIKVAEFKDSIHSLIQKPTNWGRARWDWAAAAEAPKRRR
jgi:hypothetical protein